MALICRPCAVALLCLPPMEAPAAAPVPEAPAQALVEKTLARHPELAHVVLHVTPPGRSDVDNIIIASSIGRIGKRADQDDLRILRTGAIEAVVTKSGDRFNVSLPLLDRAGRVVGIVALGFPYQPGDDQEARRAAATRIRDEMRGQIRAANSLFSAH
jgi:hypothetical protein